MLYMIGIGLSDEKDITVKGLEAVKSCEHIYLENYTNSLSVPVEKLEEFYGKKIILADRDLVEKSSDEILLSLASVYLIAAAESPSILPKFPCP